MMKAYFDNLVHGIESKLREEPESKSPRKIYALEVARLGSRLYDEKSRVAWCGITAPFDLLTAMGATSCFAEFVGAMLAATGDVDRFIESAEQAGYAGDSCGYHRSVMGAALNGLMPEPDFLIATTCPCTGGIAVMENLARHFNKDLFLLTVPLENSEKSVRYLADQIREMVEFVSSHTGDALDLEKLRETVERTNRARELLAETYQLACAVPSPTNGRMLANFGIAMLLLLGTEAGVTVAREYRDDFSDRVEKGIAGVPGERHRLLWIQNRIQFKNPLVDLLENDFKTSIVIDELNTINWDPIDPDDPFIDMARRAIINPFNGWGARRVEHLKKLAVDYRIDGAVNPCNWGCRQGAGARGLLAKELKEIDIPVLNLEVDCVDPRNFSEGQLRTRIEAFVEMLDNRPSS
jgi:benzoyl-CoA reductase/2-hydroxyglutaryl-CoA dehydratase subunit BcrC/BadD/HgdB